MGIEMTSDNKGIFSLGSIDVQKKVEHLWNKSKWTVIVASFLIEAGFIGLGIVTFKGLANAIDIDRSAYYNIGNNPALSVTIEGTGLFKDDFGLWLDLSTPCIPDSIYKDGGKRIVKHTPLLIWNRDPELYPDIPHDYTIACQPRIHSSLNQQN